MRGGDRVASRVRVAASACLVASGLLIGGAGGAMALADPEHGNGRSDDTTHDDSVGGIVRRAFSVDGGNGEKASEPRQRPQTRSGNGRDGQDSEDGQQPTRTGSPTDTKPTETKPTETKPTDTPSGSPTSDTPTTTKPTTTTETTTPPGQPPPNPPASSGGGGGGVIAQLPRFTPPRVPGMQLPQELTPKQPGMPGGPDVLDAGAGAAAAAAPVGPAAPIGLPVIVAPPVGLGAGAGGAGSGAAAAAPPALPRAVTAEPPAGRVPPPANAGRNVAVPNSSYRLGYTEYLRTAGLPQVAALAVPGLVGILVLTGAGGLVGYRQAKAGHAVRVGSSARFMR